MVVRLLENGTRFALFSVVVFTTVKGLKMRLCLNLVLYFYD